MESSLVIRGRVITPSDIEQIKTVVKRHWARGHYAISRELCKLWRQPNGILKEQVCRILLRQLEQKNLIELPPQKRGIPNRNRRYYVGPDSPPPFSKEPITGGLRDFPPVHLKMVRREPEEHLWNYLIHQYHYKSYYKSYKIIVGSHLKYIAYMEEVPIVYQTKVPKKAKG